MAFETDGGDDRYADIGDIHIVGDVNQYNDSGSDGEFIDIDKNGNFGDILIEGGGGGRIHLGDIEVDDDLAPGIGTTGTITITSTGVDDPDTEVNEGEIWIEEIHIRDNGNIGDITITGSGTDNSRIYFDEHI